MVTENYTEFWGTDNWGRPYGYLDRIYAGGWHRGHDLLGAEWGKRPVPILRSGKVVYSAKAPYGKLGHVVVIRTENGDYDSYCHVVLLRKIKIGDKLVEGDETAIRLARWGETTGTSWTGPHLHLVRSRMLDAAWNTYRSVQDPRPVIRTQLAQAAVDDKPKPLPPAPKPTPAPEPEEEDNMTKNSGGTYTRAADKKIINIVFNTESGFEHEFASGGTHQLSDAYMASMVKLFDIPNGFQQITERHAAVVKAACAAVRPAGAPTDLRVEIVDE